MDWAESEKLYHEVYRWASETIAANRDVQTCTKFTLRFDNNMWFELYVYPQHLQFLPVLTYRNPIEESFFNVQ